MTLAAVLAWARAHGRQLTIAGLVLGALVLLSLAMCGRHDDTPIPEALGKKLEAHAIASAVDSSEIHRLKAVAASAQLGKDSALRKAHSLQLIALSYNRRADSLAHVATLSTTASDSARSWHAAYDQRTLEADSLTEANRAKDVAIGHLETTVAVLDTALKRSESGKARADSVIAAAVDVVKHSDPPCSFLRFFPCISRTKAAVGGVVVGAVSVALVPRVVQTIRGK